MPGANCSIVGCSTSRKNKDVGIFKLPTAKNEYSAKWRADILNIITKDRYVDAKFKNKIDKDTVYVCERHFEEDDIYHYLTRKELKEGVLPTLNLPVKSIPTTSTNERASSSIAKREAFQEDQLSLSDHVFSKSCYKDLPDFKKKIGNLKLRGWTIIENDDNVEICKYDDEYTIPKYQVFVDTELKPILRCFGWILPNKNSPLLSTYGCLRDITLSHFIQILDGYHMCKGLDLIEFREAYHLEQHIIPKVFTLQGKTDLHAPLSQDRFIRSQHCSILIENGVKCGECEKLEVKTRSGLNRKRKVSSTPAQPNAPIAFTSPERVLLTLQSQRKENKKLKLENEDLIQKLQDELNKNCVPVSSDLDADLVDIFQGVPEEDVPPFMRLFWKEQQRYIRTKNKKQIRYHPAVIKYCLSIAAKSPSAYEQMRLDKDGSGVLILPSQRTLRNYRNYIKPQQGFNPEVIEDLTKKTADFSDSERFVSIIIDEMKIQEDLVWDTSGNLIGFLDFGDTNINESMITNKEKLATHIMVFIVKSIKNPLSFSFANFATDSASSGQIYLSFWKAVSILETKCNLKVIASVADGASTNRKFVKMHGDDNNDFVYRTKNVYASEDRFIYFFADAPHLIKTARNCLWKSGSDYSSRFMWNNGYHLLWQHIKDLYNEDLDCGLKLMPKLTADHIILNSYSVMRVNLASQILSESVGKALAVFGIPEAKGTSDFCLMLDKFFDCFNVRNTHEFTLKRKNFLRPYTSATDERFMWLNSFIGYLENWKESIENRPDAKELTATQKNNMFLSLPTYEGIRLSIYSLREIVPYLLNHGFDYVLSEKFCQDDIENYFGRQRAIGRRKDNPTVRDSLFFDNIIKTQYDIKPIKGNVRAPENIS